MIVNYIAQWIKTLAAKMNNLSSIPGPRVVKGDSTPTSCPPYVMSHVHTYTQMSLKRKTEKKKVFKKLLI